MDIKTRKKVVRTPAFYVLPLKLGADYSPK